jgi:tetratricopeptide (TPR) repeat protein
LKIRRQNKIPPDTTQLKGTITLYLSEKLNNEVKQLYNDLIIVVESYFNEYPNGEFEDSFFSYLISAYGLQGQHEKVQEICKILYNSDKHNLKLKAAFHLGRYAHFKKNYKTAIDYYNFILSKLVRSENRILYNYLVANCYFELKDIENTNKYLNNVFRLTENVKNNDMRKMAEIMANHLKKNAEKFNRHVVVFRDPANES